MFVAIFPEALELPGRWLVNREVSKSALEHTPIARGNIAFTGPDLRSPGFGVALALVGAGLGLLASQLGNINMSAVPPARGSEVGGLQGTAQNLGASSLANSAFLHLFGSFRVWDALLSSLYRSSHIDGKQAR